MSCQDEHTELLKPHFDPDKPCGWPECTAARWVDSTQDGIVLVYGMCKTHDDEFRVLKRKLIARWGEDADLVVSPHDITLEHRIGDKVEVLRGRYLVKTAPLVHIVLPSGHKAALVSWIVGPTFREAVRRTEALHPDLKILDATPL